MFGCLSLLSFCIHPHPHHLSKSKNGISFNHLRIAQLQHAAQYVVRKFPPLHSPRSPSLEYTSPLPLTSPAPLPSPLTFHPRFVCLVRSSLCRSIGPMLLLLSTILARSQSSSWRGRGRVCDSKYEWGGKRAREAAGESASSSLPPPLTTRLGTSPGSRVASSRPAPPLARSRPSPTDRECSRPPARKCAMTSE